MNTGMRGWLSGAEMLVAIFAPSFLLVAGTLPFWETVRRNARAQATLAGVNAAVVGLLIAALYHPVWTTTVFGLSDVTLVALAFIALAVVRIPPLVAVCASAAAGWMVSRIA